jgi:hypothetical protein
MKKMMSTENNKLLILQKLASDIHLIDINIVGLHAVFEGFLFDKLPKTKVTDTVLKKISTIAMELNVCIKLVEEMVDEKGMKRNVNRKK